MSEEVAATPAEPEVTAAPEPPTPQEPSSAEKRDSLVQRMLGRTTPGDPVAEAEPDPPAADDAPAEAEPPAEDAPAEAEPAPEPEKSPEAARLARALVDLERSQAQTLRAKKVSQDLEARIAAAKGNGEKALEFAGLTVDDFLDSVVTGKTKKPDEPELTPEQQAMADMKEQLAALQAERDEAQAKGVYQQEVAAIAEHIKDRDIASAFPWAADRIYTAFYEAAEKNGEPPLLDDITEQVESAITSDLRSALSTERTVKALLADPATREVVLKALGPDAPKTAKPAQQENKRATKPEGDGPSVITPRMAAEIPARAAAETLTRAQRKERGVAILLQNLKK